jgi:hypothetical protein
MSLLIGFLIFAIYVNKDAIQNKSVIKSDGGGYYAHLPCLFIYGDYETTYLKEAEAKGQKAVPPAYLFKNDKGKLFNKYAPGVAFVQTPFFLIAYFVADLSGVPIDGYSTIFQLFFLIGSLFYSILGFYFLRKILEKILGRDGSFGWLTLFCLSTPILFYAVFSPSMTHAFSFSFFAIFAYLILLLKYEKSTRNWFLTGLVLVILLLIRPTNALVLLTIPFLLGDWRSVKDLIFSGLKRAWIWLTPLLFVFSIQLIITRLQVGEWKLNNYPGEGFNWSDPKIFQVLFSFRSGIFVQFPVLMIGFAGLILWIRRSAFSATAFICYFAVVTYVNSSWWCWDYESYFGNRAFTEHLLFLSIPLGMLYQKFSGWTSLGLLMVSLLSVIRLYTFDTGYMSVQRFTSDNYFESMLFWKDENFDRWNFTRSCKPYGEQKKNWTLFTSSEQIDLDPSTEFTCNGFVQLPKGRTTERYYYIVQLDKQLITGTINDVFLVVDATSSNSDRRYYYAIPLYNDRYEARGQWKHLEFEGSIVDNLQEFDKIAIYVWNPGKKHLLLKNVRVELIEFSSDHSAK